MKRQKKLKRAFGLNELGFIDFPPKISGIMISRLIYCKKECPFCFPHGWEMSNATWRNNQRNWKKFRKAKWKLSS